jgi:vacuolar-type H+-ATPase subunit H
MTADGRRPIYTDRPDIIERLLDALRAGNTIRNACNYAGIRPSTYFAWTAKARKETADIVATAKTEATQMVEKADKNAKARAERIVAEAHEEIDKSVIAAKKTLERETLQLVKKAAGLAVAGVADSKLDEKLIKKSIEEAK